MRSTCQLYTYLLTIHNLPSTTSSLQSLISNLRPLAHFMCPSIWWRRCCRAWSIRLNSPISAPQANAPTPAERDTCAPWMDAEVALLLPQLRAVVALGAFAWQATLGCLSRLGIDTPRPRPRFGHGAEVDLGGVTVVGSFHPSQQNTFTGRLTEPMLDAVLTRACDLAGG